MTGTKPHMDRLAQVDTCAVSDALDKIGLEGVVSGVKPLTIPRRVCGRVLPVELGPIDQSKMISVQPHLGAEAIDSAFPSDVIVVANAGRIDVAAWGGILSRAAHQKRASGVIVDGAVRDIDEITAAGFPVYGIGSTPKTARGRITTLSYNEQISFGGINVSPDDYVIADSTGVVFIPQAEIKKVLELAEEIANTEAHILKSILDGMPVSDAMNKNYEDLIR